MGTARSLFVAFLVAASACAGGTDQGAITEPPPGSSPQTTARYGTQDLWLVHSLYSVGPDGGRIDIAGLLLEELRPDLAEAVPLGFGLQLEAAAVGGDITDATGRRLDSIDVSLGRISLDPATMPGSLEHDVADGLLAGAGEALVIFTSPDLEEELVNFSNDDVLRFALPGVGGAAGLAAPLFIDFVFVQAIPLSDGASEAGLDAVDTLALRWQNGAIAILGADLEGAGGLEPVVAMGVPVGLTAGAGGVQSLRGGSFDSVAEGPTAPLDPEELNGEIRGKLLLIAAYAGAGAKAGWELGDDLILGLVFGPLAPKVKAALIGLGFAGGLTWALYNILIHNEPDPQVTAKPGEWEGGDPRYASPPPTVTVTYEDGCEIDLIDYELRINSGPGYLDLTITAESTIGISEMDVFLQGATPEPALKEDDDSYSTRTETWRWLNEGEAPYEVQVWVRARSNDASSPPADSPPGDDVWVLTVPPRCRIPHDDAGASESPPTTEDPGGLETEGPVDGETTAGIMEFVGTYEAAVADGAVDVLLSLIHPGVLGVYGLEQCEAALVEALAPNYGVEVVEITRFGDGVFQLEGGQVEIPETFVVNWEETTDGWATSTFGAFYVGELGADSGQFGWVAECGAIP